jgi:aspartate carbamoyltransferase regulatory subunit
MSKGTLDPFFQTQPKAPTKEERCSNPHCRKIIKPTDTKFQYKEKGQSRLYCQACYKAKMKLLEENEASI